MAKQRRGKLMMRFWGPGDRFALVLRFTEVRGDRVHQTFSVATPEPSECVDGFQRLQDAWKYARELVGLPVDIIEPVISEEAA